MENILGDIDYKGIFKYFEEICSIPHGSKNNKAISNYLVKFAKDRNLFCIQDEFYNVIIIKDATKGLEACEPIIIQGHMDMVCEKRADISHDFENDPLNLKLDGDFLYADGTTLGGDDGIAVAYALALLDDNSILHPRLEIVITTDEEVGMNGAIGLNVTPLKGKYMLNIDSEEEGILLSSSAGGLTGTCELPIEYEEAEGFVASLSISKLQGGHSGTEINKNRSNAAILMGRFLFELGQKIPYSIMDIHGGQKDNAIPRESYSKILIESHWKEEFISTTELFIQKYKQELKSSEPKMEIIFALNKEVEKNTVIEKDFAKKIIFMLLHAPNGVQVMSSNIKELVESSLNLGILKIENKKVCFCYSVRSSVSSYKKFLSDKLHDLSEFIGGTYYVRGEYEPWEYKENSKLRELLVKVYKDYYGKEPKIEAIHAGLECGIIASKIKELDIVSFGPDIYDIHTPEEKLSISSAKRVYDYLLCILKEICEKNEQK